MHMAWTWLGHGREERLVGVYLTGVPYGIVGIPIIKTKFGGWATAFGFYCSSFYVCISPNKQK
jgi:hypothetical protein